MTDERDASLIRDPLSGPAGGAAAGGLAGKGVAETIDPTVEDKYWGANYSSSPYVTRGAQYRTYRPAYRYGWESYERYQGRHFEDVEPELQRGWDERRGYSTLTWEKAKAAIRDAWHRVERALPADAGKGGG